MLLPAACVLLPTQNTIEEILAISRRNDTTQWGIPGGKQDSDECNVDCALREISEECGLVLDKTLLIPLYSGACYGKDGRHFWVTTYLYPKPRRVRYLAEEGFEIKPMEIETLCNPEVSPFSDYNIKVRDAWRAYYG
jgi:8-oxo-dGTP pyrophosphatase MutT (NUDIX family)